MDNDRHANVRSGLVALVMAFRHDGQVDLVHKTCVELLQMTKTHNQPKETADVQMILGELYSQMKQHDRALDVYRHALLYYLIHQKDSPELSALTEQCMAFLSTSRTASIELAF